MLQVQIHVAFQNVPAPSLTRRGYEPIFDAQGGFSSIRELDVPVALPDDWRLLSDEVLQQVALDLEDLAPAAFRYFLPAVLTSALHPSRRSSLAYALAKSLDIGQELLDPDEERRDETFEGYAVSRKQFIGKTLSQIDLPSTVRDKYDWLARYHNEVITAWFDTQRLDLLVEL